LREHVVYYPDLILNAGDERAAVCAIDPELGIGVQHVGLLRPRSTPATLGVEALAQCCEIVFGNFEDGIPALDAVVLLAAVRLLHHETPTPTCDSVLPAAVVAFALAGRPFDC
jgi:hypothetical protein